MVVVVVVVVVHAFSQNFDFKKVAAVFENAHVVFITIYGF